MHISLHRSPFILEHREVHVPSLRVPPLFYDIVVSGNFMTDRLTELLGHLGPMLLLYTVGIAIFGNLKRLVLFL